MSKLITDIKKSSSFIKEGYIEIHNNYLSKELVDELIELFETGHRIITLGIYNIWTSQEILVDFIKRLGKFKLEKLGLTNSFMDDETVRALANLVRAGSLKSLNVRDDKISAIGAKYLAMSLLKSNLEELRLHYNKIGKDGGNYFGRIFEENKTFALKSLTLDVTEIDDIGAISIIKGLENTQLEKLEMDGNKLTDAITQDLCEVLPKSNIQILSLGNNLLDDRFLLALSKVINATKLKDLMLYSNNLTNVGVKELMISLRNNARLWQLDLMYNEEITDDIKDEVLTTLRYHPSIRTCLIDGDRISERFIIAVDVILEPLNRERVIYMPILCSPRSFVRIGKGSIFKRFPLEMLKMLANMFDCT